MYSWRTVNIGGINVGTNHPVTVGAEIGSLFGQDIELAKEYIRFAKEIKVDFLKTEILHDLSILHDKTMMVKYNTDDGVIEENYYSLLARKQVSLKDYEKLIKYAIDIGLPVMASVYDLKGADFMKDVGGCAVKIASPNITNRPLIEHCAKTGLPFIMDAGNSYLHEVARAVQWAEDCGVNGIVINHRPDGSPGPAEVQNLRVMQTYAECFGWPVGLSCHYKGDEIVYTAIGMGASFIEKPLYHKSYKDDADTLYSLHYEEYKQMVMKIKNCSKAIGNKYRTKLDPFGLSCRACIVAGKDLKPGDRIGVDNVMFAWPMTGIQAANWKDVEGKVLTKEIKQGIPLKYVDFE